MASRSECACVTASLCVSERVCLEGRGTWNFWSFPCPCPSAPSLPVSLT